MSVAPARERGLKYRSIYRVFRPCSRSRKGAWIEITATASREGAYTSLPQGSVD